MKIIVIGGSGLIGSRVVMLLNEAGHEAIAASPRNGVNTVTGDYSRGAVGLWIENGKFMHAVQEVTIAGNLPEMLKNIEMVGSDVTFAGTISAPTLKIGNMVISGE